MPRTASLLSPLRSPYADAHSSFSAPETVETSPVDAPLEPEVQLRLPAPQPSFTALCGPPAAADPADVRALPLLFTVTYWGGLGVLYAFLLYVIVMSSSWRGPVIIWALLIPTVVFSLWRRLPGEELRVQKLCDEIVLLRCGGYFELADPNAPSSSTANAAEMAAPRGQLRVRSHSAPAAASAGVEDSEMTVRHLPQPQP